MRRLAGTRAPRDRGQLTETSGLTDYDAVHSTATYQLNQGTPYLPVTLPTALDVQTLASGTAASGISYEVKQAGNAYYISVTGTASAISADNPSTVMDGVTGVTATRHVTSNVGTQQTAILRTGATVPVGLRHHCGRTGAGQDRV